MFISLTLIVVYFDQLLSAWHEWQLVAIFRTFVFQTSTQKLVKTHDIQLISTWNHISFREEYSLDQFILTEWIWPKFVNMTKKLTMTNINMVNMTEKYIFNIFFGHVQRLRFVGVNIFWSCSYQNSVILIWSSELASI